MAAKARSRTRTEPRTRTVTIEVPVSLAPTDTREPMHVGLFLKMSRDRRLRRAVNAIGVGLDESGARLDNGHRPRYHTETLKWLLAQIADQIEQAEHEPAVPAPELEHSNGR